MDIKGTYYFGGLKIWEVPEEMQEYTVYAGTETCPEVSCVTCGSC